MGLLTSLAKTYLGLQSNDRQTLYNLLGGFNVNSLINSQEKQLEAGYEGNIDVYAVIKKIVDVSIDVPYVVERKTSDGWELFEDNTITDLMKNPNVGKGYTWNDIDEQMLIYLLANGNAYLTGQEGLMGNRILEVDVLPSPYVNVSTGSDFFNPSPSYKFELNQTKATFSQEEIEHIKLFNPSYSTVQESFCGLSIIQVAAMAVRVGNNRWEASANLLENRGALGIITDKSNRPMTPTETTDAQSTLDSRISGVNKQGKTIVTNKDLNYIQLAMSPTDLKLVEMGVVNLRAICNVFGLDSGLFNDPQNQSYNNKLEQSKALYTNAVMPINNRLLAKHNAYLVKNHYPMGDVRLRKDYSKVEALQSDKKMEADKDKVVVDGINAILNMPISNDSKKILIKDTYPNTSEDFIDSLMDITVEDETTI